MSAHLQAVNSLTADFSQTDRAGKVLIRGAYLLSRSSGVNRIKGGSVQIN